MVVATVCADVWNASLSFLHNSSREKLNVYCVWVLFEKYRFNNYFSCRVIAEVEENTFFLYHIVIIFKLFKSATVSKKQI